MRLAHDRAAGFWEMEQQSAALLLAVVLILGASGAGGADAAEPAVPATSKAVQVDKTRLRYGGKSFGEWQELFLTDLEPATRIKALPALTKFGRYGYATEAAETILLALTDDDRELVAQSIDAAASFGPVAVPLLVELFKNSDSLDVRANCARTLSQIGPEAVPSLLDLCKTSRGDARRIGTGALETLDERAADAVPGLFDLLETIDGTNHGDRSDVDSLHKALGNIGSATMPVLLERLKSPNRNTRVLAAHLIGQFGREAREATLLLRKAFKDDNVAARSIIGAALWQVAPDDEKVVAALREAIINDEPRVGEAIVRAIGAALAAASGARDIRIPVGDKFVDITVGRMPDSGPIAVKNGMILVADATQAPAFSQGGLRDVIEAASGPQTARRWEFAGVGPLENVDAGSRFATEVYWAMLMAGPHAKPFLPELITLTESDNLQFNWAAAQTLWLVGHDAAPALPALRSAIERREKQGVSPDDALLLALHGAVNQVAHSALPSVAVPDEPAER